MVDGTKSPVLKRKREGADPLWKKVKTRRKSDAAALQNGEENVQIQDVATPKPNAKASKETLVNGAHKGTPSTSRSDQKSSNTEAGKGTPGVTGPAATPAIPGTKEGLTNGIPSAEATPSTVRKQKKQPKPPAASISMGTQKKSKGTSKNTPSEIPKAVESQQTPSRTTLKSEQAQDQPAAESGAFVKTENSTPKTEQSPGRQKHKGKSQDLVRQGTAVKPKEKNKEKKKSRSRWSWSPAIGGWFLSEDPVFTNDEKCLLLANTRVLYAYATDSSTLVRTLSKPSSRISTYALSASNPSYVYTASDTGLITLWDWTDGKTVGRWDIGTNVRSITVVADPVSNMDLVYSHETGSSHIINVHALRTREQSAQTELKQILKKKATIRGMQVLLDGKIVIVTTHKSVLIGRRSQVHKSALQDYEFVWREIQSSKPVTGFDAYVRIPDQPATGGKLPSDAVDHIDLAVGDQEGVIWLFEDALSAFTRIEKTRKDGSQGGVDLDMLRPKRLHWHREAVASVKWSRDGNYLISGGAETVLVLWQLSTGKQQHLPHLTAAIENIVVSPTGASYAITLANNSIIVLSTTELEAKMNIVGVQSRRVDKEQFPRTSTPNNYSIDLFSTVPMVVDPKNPSHVLFSVPSSQPRQEITGFRPEPYLQTFDIATQHAVWKQALTRNNATDPNMAPDGRPIEEPNVKFIQISIDGKWLATVDEWVPPRDDLAYLDEGITQFNQEERMFRREIFLKFWQWDEKNEQWVLGSRLDAPHYYESIGAGARILDLVSDPSGTGFATVGEDRSLRIWRPKTRTRGGVTVHGADKAEGLITWSPYRTVDLSCSLDVLETGQADAISHIPRYAKLAFSEDGSVLAAGVSDADSGVIHIVDTSTGSIRRSITELDVTKLSCLGILGRHMIVVSRSIVVWDLVTDEVVYYISDGAWNIDRFDKTPGARLAINAEGGTFAVALPHFEVNHGSKFREAQRLMRASTTVGVFNPSHSKAISESKSPNFILSLVPEKNGKGYIALDTSTSFTLLSPDSSLLQLPTPPPENLPQPLLAGALKEESDVEDEEIDRLEQDLATLTAEDGLLYSENDKPVVRPEQLQVVFDAGPSHALPPVKDLFNAVVGLYARKPRAVGAA